MKFLQPLAMLALALLCILALPTTALASQKSLEELQKELGDQTYSLNDLMNMQMTQGHPDSLSATLTPDDTLQQPGPILIETGIDRILMAVGLVFAGVLFFSYYRLLGKIISRWKKIEFIR